MLPWTANPYRAHDGGETLRLPTALSATRPGSQPIALLLKKLFCSRFSIRKFVLPGSVIPYADAR